MNFRAALSILAVAVSLSGSAVRCQSPEQAWLRYEPPTLSEALKYSDIPRTVVGMEDSPPVRSARKELAEGLGRMLGVAIRSNATLDHGPVILLGTARSVAAIFPDLLTPKTGSEDAYWFRSARLGDAPCFIISGNSGRAVLYGAFAFLARIARGQPWDTPATRIPSNSIRMIDQWDNLDGSIERGYAGRSIFFENNQVRADLSRAAQYARLLASVGVNICSISNVNADPALLRKSFLPQLRRVADAFAPWGVRLAISVDVSSPEKIGGLPTFDPRDPGVAAWWKQTVDGIYAAIPDFAGFVVKADSEGRAGPARYGRTPADAANVIARALEPHGGLLFYRSFVYDHHLDWRNPKNDRARAAYDIFHPLDGGFDENVVIQIKHGPIDFQVREPVSPLLGGLPKTSKTIELQITQEYTGQQRQLCFLVPMWKEVLDFDMRTENRATPVRELVAGKIERRRAGGLVGVANVGMDRNWLAHPLALANLYGFARLAWDPELSPQEIAEEWTRLSFGNDPLVVETIDAMLLSSWGIYESYTGPLGIGTLTNITGNHYDPAPDSSERNGWGQWHRSDREGTGMDRTVASGTGFTGQYSPEIAKQYESLAETPDALLLFFHHVPYTHTLHSGKTVIQHIYDSHYEGAARAAGLVDQWQRLKGHIDPARYDDVLARLNEQAGEAAVWRDTVNAYFLGLSSIPDGQGRFGQPPDTPR